LRLNQGTASLGLKTDKSGDAHRHAQQLDCGDRVYQEFRPYRRLAPLVECAWVRSGSPTGALRVMPDGCVDLFVSSRGSGSSGVMIAGPATTFCDLRADKGCVVAVL
jgi:hypothetical protein